MPDDRGALENPPWLDSVIFGVIGMGALVVAGQRWGTAGAAWAVPVAVAAAVPWFVAAAGVRVPRSLWVGIVLAATGILMLEPVTGDLAPFALVSLTAVAAGSSRQASSVAILAASVGIMIVAELDGRFTGGYVWVLGIMLGWLGGYVVHLQQASHAEATGRAASEERERIARELHDVVAHSLAVTMLHLTGARLALRRDPGDAEAALRQAEESGRRSLADIRRAVGLLGAAAGDRTPSPMPGADDLGPLVEQFRAAGLAVELETVGDVARVPAAAGLGVYRIVEESLANAARHAPGHPTWVRVVAVADRVRVRVDNPAPVLVPPKRSGAPTIGGLGIPGMRHRAELLGGRLVAGPHDGGWRVEAEIPLGGADAS